jgi:peptide/nickel transport system substrate-binding protein
VDAEVYGATMRSLLRLTADGHWATDLAAAPIDGSSVVPDRKGSGFSVKVRLKPGLRWSDGQPLTMADFKATRQWVLDPNQPGINALDWQKVDRIDVSGDGLSATYHFADVAPDWMSIVGLNPPLPQHYLASVPPANGATAYPLSDSVASAPVSGPYRYEHASAQEVDLVRNDQWTASHRPYLDRIVFRTFSEDKDSLESAVSDGSVDVGLDFTADDLTVLGRVPAGQAQVEVVPTWRYEHFDINTAARGPGQGLAALANPDVRWGIAQAIDRAGLYRAMYPLGAERVGEACVNAPTNSFWIRADAASLCPTVDPAAANATLDKAGYARGANGVRVDPKTRQPLELRFCTSDDPAHHAASEYLVEALDAIGIRLDPTFVDATTVLSADWSDVDATTACSLARGTYDVALDSTPLGLDLVSDYYLAYHSSQIPSDANQGSGFNYVRFRSGPMDAALDTLRRTIDPAAAVQAAAAVQHFYVVGDAEIPLYFRPTVATVANRVHNVEPNPTGIVSASDLWNVEDWWVESGG